MTPAEATVAMGEAQQFTATGIYSDGSMGDLTSNAIWTSSDESVGTTRNDGSVTFGWHNAPSGCYATTVTDVSAAGLVWDPADPANVSTVFCK